MRYFLVFGLICIAMAGALYFFLYDKTSWNPYVDWLIALSAATFARTSAR